MCRFAYGMMFSVLLLTGCMGIGGIWLDPGNAPLSQDFPLGARWVKDGMTRESRLADWVACGGGVNMGDGFRDWISSRESRKSYFDGWDRHMSQISTCMQSKGYSFRNPATPGTPDQCDARCIYP